MAVHTRMCGWLVQCIHMIIKSVIAIVDFNKSIQLPFVPTFDNYDYYLQKKLILGYFVKVFMLLKFWYW